MADESKLVALDYRGGSQSRPVALDRGLARLADRQHGVVSRSQLMALGFTERAVHTRVDRGGLQPLYRGVYAAGHRVLTVHGRWLAAVLACGPDAVLRHPSAAPRWGLR